MSPSRTSTHASAPGSAPTGGDDTASHSYEPPKPSWKEDASGNNHTGDVKNIFRGAVIAGVVTFLAPTVLLSPSTAALGSGMADLTSADPGEGVGIATGISSFITLVLSWSPAGTSPGCWPGAPG